MKNGRDRIIFPLDVATGEEARSLVRKLSGSIGVFKVGLELFIRSGPGIITFIKESGDAGIFLDLKLHDIPTTVSRAMGRVAELGVTFATVHCGENRKMLEAAVEGGRGKTKVLGVTVLTSVSGRDIATAGYKDEYAADINKLVLVRATAANDAGCAGVICSGLESAGIKAAFGDRFLAVTPGIRPSWEGVGTDDQSRVVTPAKAIRNGADYLVIGRPIRDADDPADAADRIAAEIEREWERTADK